MYSQRSTQSPPVPLGTRPSSTSGQTFSTVADAVISPKGSSPLLSISLSGLDTLQNILESVNTLPCIKYIAGISIKVLQIIQEVQSTGDAVRKIALRAKDVVLAVARSCANAPEEVVGQLESDLQQLTETMNDILDFTQEISTRRTYQKLWNKADDAAAVKSLDAQLTHAFQIFEIQSSVSLRISQQQMVRQLSGMSLGSSQPRSPLVTGRPLRIVDGLYLIQNAADGNVIETEHHRPAPSYLHACVAPLNDAISPYQVWVVSAKHGRDTDYTISNFATGASLDVFCGQTYDGTQVICQASHAGQNQTWSLYGSRASDAFDYCTIRSHGPQTVLDGQCPAGSGCDYLHVTSLKDDSPHLSQEWVLVRLPLSISSSRLSIPPPTTISDFTLPRRRFILQNLASGSYATVAPSNGRDPNIVMQNDLTGASLWYFKHVVQDNGQYDDMFTIVTGFAPTVASLDVYSGRHIAANPGSYKPRNPHHMWKAIPRDGGFCFRNLATGKLLSQSSAAPAMHIADPAQYTQASCQWRLLDATTGAVCPVLYDSALSIPPSELSGTLAGSKQTQEYPQELVLRTSDATPAMRRSFARGLEREHDAVRDMLGSGYTSLVLAPRLITGWKSGTGLYDITLRDEDAAFGLKRFHGKGSFDTCHPR